MAGILSRRCPFLLLLAVSSTLAGPAAVPAKVEEPPNADIEKISESPDKLFVFERRLDPHRTDANFASILEIKNAKTGKTLVSWPTTGHLATALWSPDLRFVAVNDYHPSSGDSVYIASLKSEPPKLLRQPNQQELAEFFAKKTKHQEPVAKASHAAEEWEGSDIVRTRYYGKTILASFDETLYFDVTPDYAAIRTTPPPAPKAVPVEPDKSKKHGAKHSSTS